MFKTASKIRTVIGLAAAVLVISYFVADALISEGLINSTFEIGMLLTFLILLVPILLFFGYISKKNNNKTTGNKEYSQESTGDMFTKQKMKTTLDAKDEKVTKKQKSSFGIGSSQEMD